MNLSKGARKFPTMSSSSKFSVPKSSPTKRTASTRSPSTVNNSTSPKTLRLSGLKKAEIEAILLSTQKKLHDAENTLETQLPELEELRKTTARQEAALVEIRGAYYEGQVDVALAQHKQNTAQLATKVAITELCHLTQILATAETAKVAAEAQAADKSRQHETARREAHDLREQLAAAETAKAAAEAQAAHKSTQHETVRREAHDLREKLAIAETAKAAAEAQAADKSTQHEIAYREAYDLREQLAIAEMEVKDMAALRKRLAELNQRLQSSTRELADLTQLLEQNEARQQFDHQILEANAEIGRAAVAALITPPETIRLDQERLNRAARVLVDSGVFDHDWYLAQNDDVAESGLDPALHFLEYGYSEGRAPRSPE